MIYPDDILVSELRNSLRIWRRVKTDCRTMKVSYDENKDTAIDYIAIKRREEVVESIPSAPFISEHAQLPSFQNRTD